MDHIIKKLKQKFTKGLPGSVFRNRKTTTGFTLIEMMVAVSIFAIVVMISMTAILTVVDLNKKAQSMKSVMNNLNFAIETMTRSIKTGEISGVETDSITVRDQNGDIIEYSLDVDKLKKTVNGKPEIITADEVKIKYLSFTKLGSGQPSVVLILKGEAKMNERITSEFNIQSTVTQRLP